MKKIDLYVEASGEIASNKPLVQYLSQMILHRNEGKKKNISNEINYFWKDIILEPPPSFSPTDKEFQRYVRRHYRLCKTPRKFREVHLSHSFHVFKETGGRISEVSFIVDYDGIVPIGMTRTHILKFIVRNLYHVSYETENDLNECMKIKNVEERERELESMLACAMGENIDLILVEASQLVKAKIVLNLKDFKLSPLTIRSHTSITFP